MVTASASRLVVGILALSACRVAPPSESNGDSSETGDTASDPPGTDRFALLAEGEPNHLLPVKTALDVANRRLYTISATSRNIAEIDVDAAEVVAYPSFDDVELHQPEITVDGEGIVWIGSQEAPTLVRIEGGVATTFDVDVAVRAVLGRPGGGVAVATETSGGFTVRLLDADGADEAHVATAGAAGPLAWMAGPLLAVGLSDEGNEVLYLDPADLSEKGRGESPFRATAMAALAGGALAVVNEAKVGIAGETSASLAVGDENTAVVPIGDDLLALDRNGPEEIGGPFYGAARRFDPELEQVGDAFLTGFNSGYGGLDPETDLLWFNSEGTCEAWAMDPATGEAVHKVRLGLHVEDAVTDGEIVWFTGRLAGLVGRFDRRSGELLVRDDLLRWPVRPALFDGDLWVLDEIQTVLHRLDADSLDPVESVDTGLGLNPALTFGDVAADATRGTFFVTHGESNVLVEVDPVSGAISGPWALSGDPVENHDRPGRLEVLLHGGRVITHRTSDGQLSVVDPDGGEVVAEATLDRDAIKALESTSRLDRIAPGPTADRFFVGGLALDATTLARVPGEDVDVLNVIAPMEDGRLLCLGEEGVVVVEPGGATGETLDLSLSDTAAAAFFPAGESVAFTDAHAAAGGVFDLGVLED